MAIEIERVASFYHRLAVRRCGQLKSKMLCGLSPYRIDVSDRRVHRNVLRDPRLVRQVQAAAMWQFLAPDKQISCVAAYGNDAERFKIFVSRIRIFRKAVNPFFHFSVKSRYAAERPLILSDIVQIEYPEYVKTHRQ